MNLNCKDRQGLKDSSANGGSKKILHLGVKKENLEDFEGLIFSSDNFSIKIQNANDMPVTTSGMTSSQPRSRATNKSSTDQQRNLNVKKEEDTNMSADECEGDDPASPFPPYQASYRKRLVTYRQLKSLWHFLNKHKDIAVGDNKSAFDRHRAKQMWAEVARVLNKGDGAKKSGLDWSKYWGGYKIKLRRRNTVALSKIDMKFLKLMRDEVMPYNGDSDNVSTSPLKMSISNDMGLDDNDDEKDIESYYAIDVIKEPFIMSEYSRRVTYTQLKALWHFLNEHKDLAVAYNKSIQDRRRSKQMWARAAKVLNSAGNDSAKKTGHGWSKYWVDYKAKLKRKSRTCSTGDLSDLEFKFLSLLGCGVAAHRDSDNDKSSCTSPTPTKVNIVPSTKERRGSVVSNTQLSCLWGILKKREDIALGFNRTDLERRKTEQFWKGAAKMLNRLEGTVKSASDWSKYWLDYKSKLKRKHRSFRNACKNSDHGNTEEITDLEYKFLTLLGIDIIPESLEESLRHEDPDQSNIFNEDGSFLVIVGDEDQVPFSLSSETKNINQINGRNRITYPNGDRKTETSSEAANTQAAKTQAAKTEVAKTQAAKTQAALTQAELKRHRRELRYAKEELEVSRARARAELASSRSLRQSVNVLKDILMTLRRIENRLPTPPSK